MHSILLIFKKEFKQFFLSPIAYVFITVYLVITNFIFFQGFFIANQADMRQYFGLLPWSFLFFVPVVTMRSWAEEKKGRTLELLLTWPLSDREVVLGKFLASFCFLGVALLFSLSIPITIAIIGNPDMGPIVGGYIGALLMGAGYLSIGLWCSSMTENQITAFITSLGISVAFFLIGNQFVTMKLPSAIVPVFNYLGIGNHFDSIGRGVIDSRDIVYYISLIGFFLFLNVRSLESRKWE